MGMIRGNHESHVHINIAFVVKCSMVTKPAETVLIEWIGKNLRTYLLARRAFYYQHNNSGDSALLPSDFKPEDVVVKHLGKQTNQDNACG